MSRHRLTYPKRLFLWLLGYSLLLVGCFVVFQYHREKQFKVSELDSQLQLVNTYILTELEKGVSFRDIDLSDFHKFKDLRVTVIDNAGNVIYDNTLDSVPGSNHLHRREILKAMRDGSGYTVRRHSESTGATYFYSAKMGDNDYIVRTAVPYSVSLSGLLRADYGFLWFMSVITLLMCILGYYATKRVGVHISRLNAFADSVEKGERICDIEPFPHDELGEISNHIIRLYARLQEADAARVREHKASLREQQEKERIKKQLTNNINHELKTPVASIQVCVETLLAHKNLSEEKRQDFLERCLANTERLKRLLADVSLITRMDDGGTAITKEPVELSSVVEEVVAECEPLAQAKGITIDNGISTPVLMEGNHSLLASIFRNLIDNAIAYSGGDRITLKLVSAGDNRIEITVEDNGTGVAEEHIPHLFERFYRVDKGRSRAMGGTGLGLSIVKNAVAFHGGRITVANRHSGGLRFNITFS